MNIQAIRQWVSYPTNQLLLGLIAVPGFFLVRAHWDHVVAYSPYLLLLLCPLMHLFMHGAHHGGGADQRDKHHD